MIPLLERLVNAAKEAADFIEAEHKSLSTGEWDDNDAKDICDNLTMLFELAQGK